MQQNDLLVSENFKKMTFKAIAAIIFFIITYLVLIALAVALTIACLFIGIGIIVAHPSFITLMLGIGIVIMGGLVLIFLFKFITKRTVVDRSHLIEITRQDEPQLFAFIDEIVQEVETDFPKKIYLSTDVNACVFYDSSFWSMFFPIKKNLQIGLGLVNSVSKLEFKAILAHEFGHFSQRSMKVGSYVYNVNQVIYNLLGENTSYVNFAQRIADISGYFALFAMFAMRIVSGIQWILRGVYKVVNLSYMSLSREMEFHADAVAAHVAGSRPLVTSLLRLDLAEKAYNSVLNNYGGKIERNITSPNIYPKQQYVMNFLAEKSQLSVQNNLPLVTLDHQSRFNRSKLVIKNQWASHPSTDDRVEALNALNITRETDHFESANTLFSQPETLQKRLTTHLFQSVKYSQAATPETTEAFAQDYQKGYENSTFHPFFKDYYDNKNPELPKNTPLSINALSDDMNPSVLFGAEKMDFIFTKNALESDIETLKRIAKGDTEVQTFDYDGTKYKAKSSAELMPVLEKEIAELSEKIAENDTKIYQYFQFLAKKANKTAEFNERYQHLVRLDKDYSTLFQAYVDVYNGFEFTQNTADIDDIKNNLMRVLTPETNLKKHIKSVMSNPDYAEGLTPDMRKNFDQYLSKDWIYFNVNEYMEDNLGVMYRALHGFYDLISSNYFQVKKQLLDFEAGLVDL